MQRSCEESCQLTISCPLPDQAAGNQPTAPFPHRRMPGAQDFVANLARANKEYKEIKTTVDAAILTEKGDLCHHKKR
jgi:hypothetical protein